MREESLAPSLFCSVSFRLPHTLLHFHQWQNQIQFSSSNLLLTFITSIASGTSAEHIFQSQVVPLSKTAKCFDDVSFHSTVQWQLLLPAALTAAEHLHPFFSESLELSLSLCSPQCFSLNHKCHNRSEQCKKVVKTRQSPKKCCFCCCCFG